MGLFSGLLGNASKKDNDKVDVSFNNNEIIIKLNNQPIRKQKVVPYNFFIGFKMVLKCLS